MSWDIRLVPSLNKNDIDIDKHNYTYNVLNMYKSAMNGKTPTDLHGMKGQEAIPLLEKSVQNMEDDPDRYRSMNPTNQFGNYTGALLFLATILDDCVEQPHYYIEVQ